MSDDEENGTRRRWTEVSEHSTERVGSFRGRPYYLTLRVAPNFDRIRDFAAVVHYIPADTADRDVQIARIDTAHGYTHFDRLYRRDQPRERIDVDVWEAVALLRANWRA